MIQHRLVEHEIEQPSDIARAIGEIAPNGYVLASLEPGESAFRVRLVLTETGTWSRTSTVPDELLASPIYSRMCARPTRSSSDIVGLPPFAVTGSGQEGRGGRDLRGAAREDARRREAGDPALALQGPRRDERRAALGDDDGPVEAPVATGRRRRRSCRRPSLLDADGRPGRAAARLHRAKRTGRGT